MDSNLNKNGLIKRKQKKKKISVDPKIFPRPHSPKVLKDLTNNNDLTQDHVGESDRNGNLEHLPIKESDNERLKWTLNMLLVFILSFGTRFYKIDLPNHICWDETHFGKMGGYYINRTFFMDVHPPLGKMLIGLSGYLAGYNGSYPFLKPGDEFIDVPYVAMRSACATLGALLPVLCFGIVFCQTKSHWAAIISAFLVIFDNGTLTLSQYILLDPFLLFFILLATFCFVKFTTYHIKAFSLRWWFWLFLTGVSLACAVSIKFVGLFTVSLVGFSTLSDLWSIYGDLRLSLYTVFKHFLARVVCLICVPALVYSSIIAMHFYILNKSGTGDSFFSSAFQSTLIDNSLHNVSMPEDVLFGSKITIKNHRIGGGYLHSHWHLYPDGVGAKQQQVTTYGHKDNNNYWIIKPMDGEMKEDGKFIKNGDLVRLEHYVTERNLHSHKLPAPISQRHYQVTGYGWNGTGDANDVFKVEIIDAQEDEQLKALQSIFKLVHYNIGCAVYSHSKQLPKWGFNQMEVTCNSYDSSSNTHWNIEEIIDDRLPNKSISMHEPTFIDKILELHAVMFQSNNGLKPAEGEITSRPWQWPIDYKGQLFSWGNFRVYLLGNPIIWWTNLGGLFLYLCIQFFQSLRRQRRVFKDPSIEAYDDVMLGTCWWLTCAWILHYLPFWFMHRVLYFHHYFPSFLFSCMFTGVLIEYIIKKISTRCNSILQFLSNHAMHSIVISVIIYSFSLFYPLAYGTNDSSEDKEILEELKWLPSWDI